MEENIQIVGEINIEISDDKMWATLQLNPEEKDKVFEASHIKALMRERGIVFGIQEELLNQIIKEKKYFEQFIIAKGQPAEHGKDGWFEFLFPVSVDTRPKILKDGSVDYSSGGSIPSVDEGQDIVYYHPATKGIDGMNVCGGIVSGKYGNELPRLRGKGFELSEDNLVYKAKVTGKATYGNDVLMVNSELTIPGDVAYTTTGDVHFKGDIHVLGNVLTGMKVVSDNGGIIVDGYVEAATLIAKKDVVLKNGMQGNGQGKIATSGSVAGKFFEQAFIDCGGSVEANAIMNSYITCGEDLKVSGRFGVIIGGSVSAMRTIQSMIIGNMAEVQTDICAGIEGDLMSLLAQCERTEKKIQQEIEQLDAGIQKISELMSEQEQPNPVMQKKKMALMRTKIDKDTRLNEVGKKKQELIVQVGKAKEAKVTILKRVFPGTRITVNGMHVKVDEEITNVEYARRGSGLISYHLT